MSPQFSHHLFINFGPKNMCVQKKRMTELCVMCIKINICLVWIIKINRCLCTINYYFIPKNINNSLIMQKKKFEKF